MHTTLPLLLVGTTSAGRPASSRASRRTARQDRLPPDLGLDLDPEEGETSFLANEAEGPRLPRASGVMTIAEDSGFEVDRARRQLGVISARWGGTDYTVKNQLILDRLADCQRRSAAAAT